MKNYLVFAALAHGTTLVVLSLDSIIKLITEMFLGAATWFMNCLEMAEWSPPPLLSVDLESSTYAILLIYEPIL